MIYKGGDVVAANTTEKTAQEITINISHGIIVEWDIGAFDEAADLLHIRVLQANFQLVPFNPNLSLRPGLVDNPFGDHYEVFFPPYQIRVLAWNEDDSYTHEYWIRITVLPEETVGTAVTTPSLIDRIKSLFGMG